MRFRKINLFVNFRKNFSYSCLLVTLFREPTECFFKSIPLLLLLELCGRRPVELHPVISVLGSSILLALNNSFRSTFQIFLGLPPGTLLFTPFVILVNLFTAVPSRLEQSVSLITILH